jgi:DNA-binding Xre family transcriptional regulator
VKPHDDALTSRNVQDSVGLPAEVRARLAVFLRGRSHREVAAIIGLSHETVRRQRDSGALTFAFVLRLCESLDLNPAWLLTGHGPKSLRELKADSLSCAPIDELARVLGQRLAELSPERNPRDRDNLAAICRSIDVGVGDRSGRESPEKAIGWAV